MKNVTEAQTVIKSTIAVSEFRAASDGANLLMVAIDSEGLTAASIYKSFDERLNPIVIVRYDLGASLALCAERGQDGPDENR